MRLALIGVGLLGGSTASAWRRAGVASEVVGFDIDAAQLARGVELGVLDRAAASASEAVDAAGCVVLAVPAGQMAPVLAEIAGALGDATIVTDVGSTKADVIAAARRSLRRGFPRFVPAHPIAGGELPGIDHADPLLFAGRNVITTPADDTDAAALLRVEAAWTACGARVERMTAGDHDRVFAAVSHLPHLLAFALVAQIAAQPDGARKLQLAGPGFRDFTRIAASSPLLWRDIALANRAALSTELRSYRGWLERLQAALDIADGPSLARVFEPASRTRRALAPKPDGEPAGGK
jgi:prephenate dehydrogenase